ncbi:hypothetical protein TNCV_3804151 [Trichonephila clavipes]|nr:hypothetical protein TNCV_3804151 [Trichonephila clavipes]
MRAKPELAPPSSSFHITPTGEIQRASAPQHGRSSAASRRVNTGYKFMTTPGIKTCITKLAAKSKPRNSNISEAAESSLRNE